MYVCTSIRITIRAIFANKVPINSAWPQSSQKIQKKINLGMNILNFLRGNRNTE